MKTADQQIIQRLNEIYDAQGGGSGAVNWGAILGTLANQTDLATALGLKQTAAQVQALIDAAGKFGTASVAITGGTTATISHGFGLCASGMSAVYTATGDYTITKSTPFTPTGDTRDYTVAVTLAESNAYTATAKKIDDSNIQVLVWASDGTSAADPSEPFTISILSIAPPP